MDFWNKLDENRVVIINKARLIAQEKCKDFKETFSLVAHLKAINMHLAFYQVIWIQTFPNGYKNNFVNAYTIEKV